MIGLLRHLTSGRRRAEAPLIAPVDKSSTEWGDAQAAKLWKGLYAPHGLNVEGKAVLDFGCSWGYLLKFLLEHENPARAIGVDVAPLWDTMQTGWTWDAWGDRLQFWAGELANNKDLEPGSIDVVLSSSVLQYLRPDQLQATLAKVHDLLIPGGCMVLRTRCFGSYIGADLHPYFRTPFPHLLHAKRDLLAHIQAVHGKTARYLNHLTPSSYLAVFHGAGFTVEAVTRRYARSFPEIERQIEAMYPWISREELLTAELECRLVKPG